MYAALPDVRQGRVCLRIQGECHAQGMIRTQRHDDASRGMQRVTWLPGTMGIVVPWEQCSARDESKKTRGELA
ncbi:hypothetical protein NDU88_003518 [Pleurodeles waltl]|uniref:Uncharacterized protein n=1 Tax=Pleurodeles waltl TaxID=8319 RepID=A0AAV7N0D0_PLEWA|nr:hypothetical protein NDU88_003518 [Pleurodeles waltl]